MPLLGGLLAAACSPPLQQDVRAHELSAAGVDTRPPVKVVDRIERKLSAHPCVGSLDRWFRRYRHPIHPKTSVLDRSRVGFFFHEAGVHGFRAGRVIHSFEEHPGTDHRSYKVVTGTYYRKNRRLIVDFCGPNV
jgi:hypothetical protein